MFRSKGFLLAPLAIGFLAGCIDQSPVQPHTNTLVVHALLDVDARDQFVIVQEVDSASGVQQQVTGATVTITAPNGRVLSGREETDSTEFQSLYRQSPVTRVYRIPLGEYGVTLTAGQVYALRVVTPSGREVTGSTTIPVSSSIASDAVAVDSIHAGRDSIAVDWPRSPFARAYELNIGYVVPNYSGTLYKAFTDSSFVMSARASKLSTYVFEGTYVNEINILAVDANYYDYYRRGSDLFGGTGIVNHLTGGIGMFGSVGRVWHRRVVRLSD